MKTSLCQQVLLVLLGTQLCRIFADPIPTQAPLENSMRGISFTAVLQSRSTNVFTSILSANIDSNAYDGINITCDDITGGSMAVLPLQLVNNPPSSPVNPRQITQASQCDCSTSRVCGNATAVVMWECPVNMNGTNVTGFTVTVDVNGTTELSISPTDLSATVHGLQGNTNYTANVTASNCYGTSEASTTTIFINTGLLPPASVSSCTVNISSIQINWVNPPGNEDLFCPVCRTRISWTVDDGTGGFVFAPPTKTTHHIPNAVQTAMYNVTVTYEAADGCEASSDISVVSNRDLECPTLPPPTNTATSTPSSSSPTPTLVLPRSGRISIGAIIGIVTFGATIILVIGIAVTIVIVICLKKKSSVRKMKGVPEKPDPVYAEVQPRTTDAHLKMKMNVAYGPIEQSYKFEMGLNVAYGSRFAGH